MNPIRWRPNTCACIIVFDDLVVSAERQCTLHSAVTGAQTLKAILMDQNRRQNYIIGIVNAQAPDKLTGHSVRFLTDPSTLNARIEVTVRGSFTNQEKNKIASDVAVRLGNTVTVVFG